jgi:hypothetical protein
VDVDKVNRKGEDGAQGKDVFWPRDLLKDDFPKARIMTFGYNTNITRGYHLANQGNIFSHARDLLYGLEAKKRKVVILVKEVLRGNYWNIINLRVLPDPLLGSP